MASGLIKNEQAVVFSLGAGADGISYFGEGVFDRTTNMVRLYVSARRPSNISSIEALATVPEPYRPRQDVVIVGFFHTSTTPAAFYGVVHSDGRITQSLGNTIREALLIGEYPI